MKLININVDKLEKLQLRNLSTERLSEIVMDNHISSISMLDNMGHKKKRNIDYTNLEIIYLIQEYENSFFTKVLFDRFEENVNKTNTKW